MLPLKPFCLLAFALCACALFAAPPAYAGAVQLTSAGQLNPADATVTYPTTGVVVISPGGLPPAVGLPNPLVVSAGGNTLTFSKPSGLFVVNSFFGPGALYTGNAYQQEGGPVTITFATGVTEVGLQAFPNFPGPPGFGFTFTAFNGTTAIGTFSVATFGTSGGVFLGVRATGGDVITSLVINHTISDFAISPVTFGPAAAAVPEPTTLVLLSAGLAGAALARRGRGQSRRG
jgi:PEP-CTERM motif